MWRQSHRRLQGERGTDLERYHQGYRHAASSPVPHTPAIQTPTQNTTAAGPASTAPQPDAPVNDPAEALPQPVMRSLAPRQQSLHTAATISSLSASAPVSSLGRLRGASQKRGWLALLATLLIVAAVVSTLAAANRLLTLNAANGAGPNRTLSISTIATGQIRDPQGAAFSPDGRSIAVLGFQSDCSFWWIDLSNCGHTLVIYDARTGTVRQSIPLETQINYPLGPIIENGTMPRPGVALSGVIHVVVSFASLGWSPDSTSVALTYTVLAAARHLTPDDELASGLLVVDVEKKTSFTIQGDTGFFAGSSAWVTGGNGASLPLWNLFQRYASPGAPLPAGLVYSWNGSGQLYAAQPLQGPIHQLPPTAGSLYPVGSPDGSAPFTIWQPGILIGPGSANQPGQSAALLATIPIWSNDGSQVTEMTVGAALQPPAGGVNSTSAPVGTSAPDATPSSLVAIPARDAALSAVQKVVGGYGWALVGWNPDGSLLADIPCFGSSGSPATEILELRSTSNGAVINSIPLALGANDHGCQTFGGGDAPTGAYPDANMTLAWSPDGARVLVCDRDGARLTLWNVK